MTAKPVQYMNRARQRHGTLDVTRVTWCERLGPVMHFFCFVLIVKVVPFRLLLLLLWYCVCVCFFIGLIVCPCISLAWALKQMSLHKIGTRTSSCGFERTVPEKRWTGKANKPWPSFTHHVLKTAVQCMPVRRHNACVLQASGCAGWRVDVRAWEHAHASDTHTHARIAKHITHHLPRSRVTWTNIWHVSKHSIVMILACQE